MSRIRRTDNVGLRITSGPQRPYGKCPRCKNVKPIHWISRTDFLCYICLKETGKQPYYPVLEKETKSSPPTSKKQLRPANKRSSPSTNKKLSHPMGKKALRRAEKRTLGPAYKSYP